jgi:hypothetical protein
MKTSRFSPVLETLIHYEMEQPCSHRTDALARTRSPRRPAHACICRGDLELCGKFTWGMPSFPVGQEGDLAGGYSDGAQDHPGPKGGPRSSERERSIHLHHHGSGDPTGRNPHTFMSCAGAARLCTIRPDMARLADSFMILISIFIKLTKKIKF